MPNKFTFAMPSVKDLLDEEMLGEWADPFSGENSPAQLRNDADLQRTAERHEDGLEFLRSLKSNSFDGILFDPPYSTEQALRKYKSIRNGTAGRAEYWARCKDEIRRIVRPGGKAICFGWDSTGVGLRRGFRLQRILLLCHGACHNDTIITVEVKVIEQQGELNI
jgi:DNA modification methylase